MGEDFGTWGPQGHIDVQSPNFDPFIRVLGSGKRDPESSFINSGINMAIRNGAVPFSRSSSLPDFNVCQSNVPHAWFYCLPRFRQAFMPTPNFTTMGTLASEAGTQKDVSPNLEASSHQKKFLVVDQSGEKTTFLFSSGFRSPIHCLKSWSPKSGCANTFGDRPLLNCSINVEEPVSMNQLGLRQKADVQSELHEDTAEIDALLYSDEDCYLIEDEVTSTGHSPIMMTKDCDNLELSWGSPEEVPSPFYKTKKRKLFEDDAQLMDTASSLNCNRCEEYESDAESRCEGGSYPTKGEPSFMLPSKRMKMDKVRHILSVLQSLIPGVKDKDPIMLLDNAIDCLKSLKVKAKLLGLDTF